MRRIAREPYHVLGAILRLPGLHVAAAIVLLHDRAAEVVRFEHHGLALVVGEVHRLAGKIHDGERGRALPGRRGGTCDTCERSEEGGGEPLHGKLLSIQRCVMAVPARAAGRGDVPSRARAGGSTSGSRCGAPSPRRVIAPTGTHLLPTA